jgi:hypothetical protein
LKLSLQLSHLEGRSPIHRPCRTNSSRLQTLTGHCPRGDVKGYHDSIVAMFDDAKQSRECSPYLLSMQQALLLVKTTSSRDRTDTLGDIH